METFAAVSLRGEEIVKINGSEGRAFPFKCRIAVGKGVTRQGDSGDTKGIFIRFHSGQNLAIDLESQKIRTPDGNIILPPHDVLHRGINLPLMELIKADVTKPLNRDVMELFQGIDDAYRGMVLISQAMRLPWLGQAYWEGCGVAELINKVPHERWGSLPWQAQAVPDIRIGQVDDKTIQIP